MARTVWFAHRAVGGVLCALLSIAPQPAWSASGDLDTTFGAGGTVVLDFSPQTEAARGAAVVSQPDGKIVVGGTKETKDAREMTLVRLHPDGSPDVTFGAGGSTLPVLAALSGVARQADGKLVAVGNVAGGIVVARYDSSGELDAGGFGAPDGIVRTQLPGSGGVATAVAVAADGRIVVAGLTYDTGAGGWDIALARLTPDGGLDDAFGAGGKVETDVGGRDDAAFAVALQLDGKIVVAGQAFNGFANGYDIALVRYDTSGGLDSTFGTGGKVMTDLGTRDDRAFALLAQPDGKLMAAGHTFGVDLLDMALVRYEANGAVDAAFGTAGAAILGVSGGHDAARAVALQADGRVVVAGYAVTGTSTDLAVGRFASDGTADTTFGNAGAAVTATSPQGEEALSVAIEPDGKIVAAGRTNVPFAGSFGGTGYRAAFVVARYLP